MSDYIYDANWESERARLAGLEAALDPNTTRYLTALGIGEGMRCLEVGAGGGSITAWMCEQVGPSGHVVATDLDTRFVSAIDAPNLEIRTHDAVAEPFESDAYDLVHSRDMLEHIPARDEVLAKLIDAVAPGGWLLIEDVDFAPEVAAGFGVVSDDEGVFPPFWRAVTDWMLARGVDPMYGRRLPKAFKDAGLEEIGGEMSARVMGVGSPGVTLSKLSFQHLTPAMVEAGSITEQQAVELKEMLDAEDFMTFSPIHVSVWGRKPA